MKRRVELSVDRRLLDANFEGYKLNASSGGPRCERVPLAKPPSRAKPLPSHRSLLHARLHALHNALVTDRTTDSPVTYFVDENGSVWVASSSNEKLSIECTLRVPDLLQIQNESNVNGSSSTSTTSAEHPPSIAFCSPTRALLASGHGRLLLLNTGVRDNRNTTWSIEMDVRPLGMNSSFTVIDARFDSLDESLQNIHCLLYSIEQDEDRCVSIIDWIILYLEDGVRYSKPYKKIKCRGVIHYCVLELNCEAIYIAAERPPEFIGSDIDAPSGSELPKTDGKKLYCWIQNSDDITLTLQLKPDLVNPNPVVNTSKDSIELRFNDTELIKGNLFKEINEELTTWSVDSTGKLNILLLKREPTIMWPSFLKDGDPNGEQILDPSVVAEVHGRLAHLCSETEVTSSNDAPLFNSQQLEECDFTSEEESCLVRLHGNSLQSTHHVFLSAHQIILNVQLSNTEVTALGVRYDADTCIWQPYNLIDDNWPIKHEGTLLAFAYIQSSKEQKKYTVCSPNLEYSVVCEPNRHAFVYKQGRQNSQLKKRTPEGENRKVKIGQQQLIPFERDEEIFGICATNEILFILTEKNLLSFEMSV